MTDRLTTKLMTEVPAVLMVVPEYGEAREATDADLEEMGYRHHMAAYRRLRHFYDLMGLQTDEGQARWIRYFIEYVTTYDHDMDEDDLAKVKSALNGSYVEEGD